MTGILMLMLLMVSSVAPATADDCVACHEEQVHDWQRSHHAKAMLPASSESVAGVFDGSVTHYNGLAFRFFRKGQTYQVAVGEGDDRQTYPIDYTFGFYPLQQYLARLPGGRYQALPVAWDARPAEDGGQRWYALESDLNWDHPGFTWNTSCADCHSTGLVKGYQADSDHFTTRFDEVNVSCAACHGEPEGHLQWLASGQATQPHAGFPVTLKARGEWQWLPGEPIARRRGEVNSSQLSSCAQCHSRRQAIGDWHPRTELFDHIMPTLPTPPAYFADGQIRDEVFVLGSFMQSRMHAAGVVCSNCHEPHSTDLLAEGDGLCLQCHKADTFASEAHHRHRPADVNCVDCHMPATVYMGVDARRDHRFGVPDPGLSERLGSPDVCRDCHRDLPLTTLQQRLPDEPTASQQRARDLARIQREGLRSSDLYRLDSGYFVPLLEAALLPLLSPAEPATRAVLQAKLKHPSPVVRAAAVRAFASASPSERWALLSPLLGDSSQAVRMELAPVLAGAGPEQPSPEPPMPELTALFAEYEQMMQANLDSPQIAANLANYHLARGDRQQAQQLYQHAIALDADFVYPYLQLSALAAGTPAELAWLHRAREKDSSGEATYQMALYHVRQRDYDAALRALKHAVDTAPGRADFSYAYAVALENQGHLAEALTVLAQLRERGQATTRTRDLELRYLIKRGDVDEAQQRLDRWLEREPANPVAQQWQRQLGR